MDGRWASVLRRFQNQGCRCRCRFFMALPFRSRAVFRLQCRLTARFLNNRMTLEFLIQIYLLILRYSKNTLFLRSNIKRSLVHIAKQLRLEKFVTATQPVIAENYTGFAKHSLNTGRTGRRNQSPHGELVESGKARCIIKPKSTTIDLFSRTCFQSQG